MDKNEWTGLGASVAVHSLLLLLLGVVVQAGKEPPPRVRLVPLDFTTLEVTAFGEAGSAGSPSRQTARAEEPTLAPPRAEPTPDRSSPPPITPVRPPSRPPTPSPAPPVARPETREDAPPQTGSVSPEPGPGQASGGTPEGRPGGQSANAGEGDGTGGTEGTGTSGVSVGGLGNRSASCARPRYPGVSGSATYAVTFAPDGRYVSSRPLQRGGDARIDAAVGGVIGSCRAQALSEGASQVNQVGTITFRFTN